jgi:hypothetical protein
MVTPVTKSEARDAKKKPFRHSPGLRFSRKLRKQTAGMRFLASNRRQSDGTCSTCHFNIDTEEGKTCNLHVAQGSFDRMHDSLAPSTGRLPATLRNPAAGLLATAILKHREETMKIRLVVALIGLATSFALPIFAQEEEYVKPFPFTPIPADPQLVQQIEAINQKFDEAFNKHDAAAVGELYTANAVQTTPQGSFSVERLSKDILQIYFSVTIHPIESQKWLRSICIPGVVVFGTPSAN